MDNITTGLGIACIAIGSALGYTYVVTGIGICMERLLAVTRVTNTRYKI